MIFIIRTFIICIIIQFISYHIYINCNDSVVGFIIASSLGAVTVVVIYLIESLLRNSMKN